MYEFLACRVGDYMVKPATTISERATIADALGLFERLDFNMLPVVDRGRLLGVVSKFDILKIFAFTPKSVVPSYDELISHPISEVATRNYLSVDAEAPLTRVLQQMIEQKIASVPVVDKQGSLIGVISRTDILHALKRCIVPEPAERR
jgi:CBS domain-containing protein